jgi:hypothetical protein
MSYDDRDSMALDRLEDLLDAYAEARLVPTRPVLARIRSAVLAEAAAAAARRRADALHTTSLEAAPPSRFAFAFPQLRVPRRAFALGMAATLTLGTSAAVLAAPPGSPFYNARLVIESALLPTQIDARLAAYEQHLEQRLNDAEAAAARGDAAALGAALAAYQADVAAIVAQSGFSAAQLAHLEEVLAKHTAVLEELALTLPEQASIDHAIEASQKAAQKINEKGANAGGNRPSIAPGGPPDGQGSRP